MAKGEITTKQRAAITALLAGGTYTEAAAAAGVHPNRVTIWMRETAFQQALRAAEGEALDAVSRSLVGIADKAAGVLEDVLDNDQANPSSRIRAADVVLTKLLAVRELASLEERIRKLEEVQSERAK